MKKGSRQWEEKDISERWANREEVAYEKGRSLVIGDVVSEMIR